MPARDFSIYPVQVVGEPKAIERAVRTKGEGGSMRVGAYVDVEFGSTWATLSGKQERMPGQWRQCQIVAHHGAIVHVVLSPDPATAPAKMG